MPAQKDNIDLNRAHLLKMARATIRLTHSIAADAELNTVLPRAEAAYNEAIMRGTSVQDAVLLAMREAIPNESA